MRLDKCMKNTFLQTSFQATLYHTRRTWMKAARRKMQYWWKFRVQSIIQIGHLPIECILDTLARHNEAEHEKITDANGKWMFANHMSLNVDTTQFLWFGVRQQLAKRDFNQLSALSLGCYLGVRTHNGKYYYWTHSNYILSSQANLGWTSSLNSKGVINARLCLRFLPVGFL